MKALKKYLIATAALIISTTASAQETLYYFSKPVNVCNNGQMTGLSKKITVKKEDGKTSLLMASLDCKKDIETIALGKFGASGEAFFSPGDDFGVIVENNETVYLIVEKDDKYDIVIGAHTDKKTAKSVDVKKGQDTYNSLLTDMGNLIANAQENAKNEEKLSRCIPVPENKYTDKYGISGVYYLAHLVGIGDKSSRSGGLHEKYVQAVNIEFTESDNTKYKSMMKVYHDGDKNTEAYMYYTNEVREGKMSVMDTHFGFDGYSELPFANNSAYLIEEGLFLVNASYFDWFNSEGSSVNGTQTMSLREKKDGETYKFFLMGKNKERVMELKNDPEQVRDLYQAHIDRANSTSREASKKSLPKQGMSSSSLKAKATKAGFQLAERYKWKTRIVQYVYITGTEWSTLRNNKTGIITGRQIEGVMVCKNPKGECDFSYVVIGQQYDGKNYGNTYIDGVGERTPTDCSGAMKYK